MAESKHTDVVANSDVVYIIHSRVPIRDVRTILEPYLKHGKVDTMHHQIDHRTGKETNRIVTVMEKSLYEALYRALDDDSLDTKGFGYFNIVPMYVLKHELRTNRLRVKIPQEYSDEDAKRHIMDKLSVLADRGMFSMKDVDVRVKYQHRGDNPIHAGSATVFFKDPVSLATVALVQKALQHSYWTERDNHLFDCFVIRPYQASTPQTSTTSTTHTTTRASAPVQRTRSIRGQPLPLVKHNA
jgi:hypothetical protein